MASITKLYLRDAAWSPSGTLGDVESFSGIMPGTASVDANQPNVVGTGASTNRSLEAQAGTSQTSGAITTLAQTAAQTGWLRRFISDPLNAQTIDAQTITYSGAHSESNPASDFVPSIGLYIWRPSNGTKVATLLKIGDLSIAEPGTNQTAGSATATSTAGTAETSDVLVLEVWRKSGTQVNATARTNTVFYDGTTEGSTTSVAAFVSFATAVNVQELYTSSLDASASFSGALTPTLIPAPSGPPPSLTAVLTHTE